MMITIADQGRVLALVEQFHRLSDPQADPDARLRRKLRKFISDHLDGKGSEGSSEEEASAALRAEIAQNPAQWPHDPDRLAVLLSEVFDDPDRLPTTLSPPAQLLWLGAEGACSIEVEKAALHRLFPTLTPPEIAAASEEASAYLEAEAHRLHLEAAMLRAWAEVARTRGRPESECVLGACVEELGVLQTRTDGSQYLDFNRIYSITDPEMRRAVVGAVWRANEDHRSAG